MIRSRLFVNVPGTKLIGYSDHSTPVMLSSCASCGKIMSSQCFDYASQLWAPNKQLDIKSLEDIFRNYSAQAQKDNNESLDFWSRLVRYNIRSQQRRSKRFRVICTWKILEKITPNCGLSWSSNEKTGRVCSIPVPSNKASDRVKTLKISAFQTRGPKLFNSLPYYLRELTGCSLNSFKNNLDKYLDLFPDMALSQKYQPVPN